ncbi:hypothetical protein PBR20603_00742 [Pandoraea bronchicola]|uniref:Uncharacterized protein n=1 Tax=Pandoraea bronchicola TaxID=2508287 RepID=A0A5E5BRB0_9BURK|nr:hypothetical protein PBR20603_00742 [Pandoraea bronchicola]
MNVSIRKQGVSLGNSDQSEACSRVDRCLTRLCLSLLLKLLILLGTCTGGGALGGGGC